VTSPIVEATYLCEQIQGSPFVDMQPSEGLRQFVPFAGQIEQMRSVS
jgi:hypothetical protein